MDHEDPLRRHLNPDQHMGSGDKVQGPPQMAWRVPENAGYHHFDAVHGDQELYLDPTGLHACLDHTGTGIGAIPPGVWAALLPYPLSLDVTGPTRHIWVAHNKAVGALT